MSDPRLLLLILLLGFALLSTQLWLSQRGTLRQLELRIWAQGTRIMLCGFGILALRSWLPLWVSVLFGNGLVMLAVSLYVQALYRHVLDRPLPLWYWVLLAASVLLLLATLDAGQPRRISLYSAQVAILLLPGARLGLAGGREAAQQESANPLIRSVGATLGLASLILLARAVHAHLAPQDYGSPYEGGLVQMVPVLVFFLLLGGSGFGFVLASFEREARRMEALATTDGLTGCLNRSTTDAMLAHALARGQREGRPVAFAILDLDHFKQINDRHGHPAGDAVLRAFAREVRSCLRVSDVLGRMGGEEFGLILPDTDGSGAMLLLEDIRQATESLALHDGQGRGIRVTVSAGLCMAGPASELTAARVYTLADRALYRAKSGGRNRAVCIAGPETAAPQRPFSLRY